MKIDRMSIAFIILLVGIISLGIDAFVNKYYIIIALLNITVVVIPIMLYKNIHKEYLYNIKNTIFEVTSRLFVKWFDWLKIVIIIGTISALNTDYKDVYLELIIIASYIALFFDIFSFVYTSYKAAFCKPYENTLKKMASDGENLIESEMKKIFAESRVIPEEMRKNEIICDIKENAKKLSGESIMQYKSTNTLNTEDRIFRKINYLFDFIRLHLEDQKEAIELGNETALATGLTVAAIITLDSYFFIYHFVTLYSSNRGSFAAM